MRTDAHSFVARLADDLVRTSARIRVTVPVLANDALDASQPLVVSLRRLPVHGVAEVVHTLALPNAVAYTPPWRRRWATDDLEYCVREAESDIMLGCATVHIVAAELPWTGDAETGWYQVSTSDEADRWVDLMADGALLGEARDEGALTIIVASAGSTTSTVFTDPSLGGRNARFVGRASATGRLIFQRFEPAQILTTSRVGAEIRVESDGVYGGRAESFAMVGAVYAGPLLVPVAFDSAWEPVVLFGGAQAVATARGTPHVGYAIDELGQERPVTIDATGFNGLSTPLVFGRPVYTTATQTVASLVVAGERVRSVALLDRGVFVETWGAVLSGDEVVWMRGTSHLGWAIRAHGPEGVGGDPPVLLGEAFRIDGSPEALLLTPLVADADAGVLPPRLYAAVEEPPDGVIDHTCGHTHFGPFEDVVAQPTQALAGAAPLARAHISYRIELESDGAAGHSGFVELRQTGSSEQVTLFFDRATPLRVHADDGSVVAPRTAERSVLCSGITSFVEFVLPSAGRYAIELGPTNHAEVTLTLEREWVTE